MVSIIIYFHTSRLANLRQMLRFLVKREPYLDAELILVKHDDGEVPDEMLSHWWPQKIVHLPNATYRKPAMCNAGVAASSGDWLWLLDSDRVLPFGFVSSVLNENRPNEFYSLRNHVLAPRDYSDADIDSLLFDFEPDYRDEFLNSAHRKNMFSGNTLIRRADWDRMGGMDESYVGYGFADNDACMTAYKAGLVPVLLKGLELHLFHPQQVCCDGKLDDHRSFWIAINGARFYKKWGLPLDDRVQRNLACLVPRLQSIPPTMREEYHRVMG